MIPKTHSSKLFRFAVLLATVAFAARADVKLHGLFSDNMVLQQGVPVKIWGWAGVNEAVTVTLAGATAQAKPDASGRWLATLPAQKAGGPLTLTVTGKNTLTLTNVLVGEVWIASGQSNMEWPLRAAFEAEKEIAGCANPRLRLYTVPKLKADRPVDNVNAAWQDCNPQTSPGFSAVGYFFGRDLQKALNVPVGIIHTSWGGSPAEVWMSEKTLASNEAYRRDILDEHAAQIKRVQEAVAKWEAEKADAEKNGRPFNKRRPGSGWKPAELYNGMIAPLMPFPIQGAIWYQGESNAGRAHQYRTLFPDMIRNWRNDWGQGDLTFLLVQLAPFMAVKDEPGDSAWAELREAQLFSTEVLPRVGMAVITDVGDPKDIHPKKKEPVGTRLALAARAIAYGEQIEYAGPVYKTMEVKDGKAILSFSHVSSGLEARGGELKGFAVCGEDRKFVWARAEIQGDTVVVSSPEVPKPVAVRFGWADCPVVNLWNKAGLPATPFRTDEFPMITAPKKAVEKK